MRRIVGTLALAATLATPVQANSLFYEHSTDIFNIEGVRRPDGDPVCIAKTTYIGNDRKEIFAIANDLMTDEIYIDYYNTNINFNNIGTEKENPMFFAFSGGELKSFRSLVYYYEVWDSHRITFRHITPLFLTELMAKAEIMGMIFMESAPAIKIRMKESKKTIDSLSLCKEEFFAKYATSTEKKNRKFNWIMKSW